MKEEAIHRLLDIFLAPLSFLWDRIYRWRRFCYQYEIFRQENFNVPIISIGNLSFGGTGKTPLTIWLARVLNQKNAKVMILSRGYKGALENSHGLIKAAHRPRGSASDYGDEGVLMARKIGAGDIVVGKRRARNLKYYLPRERPDIVLLEDGHQHLQIYRDLNILIIDPTLPLHKFKTAPIGHLREGPSALRDADIILFGQADRVSKERIAAIRAMIEGNCGQDVAFGRFSYRPVGLFNANFEKVYENNFLEGRNVLAISGIASPESFHQTIENLGGVALSTEVFRDHFAYGTEETQKRLKERIQKAIKENMIVLTTEKDMVKLRHSTDLCTHVFYLGIEIEFLEGESKLVSTVESYLEGY